ncbi:MAG TPA: OmpA family protein [Methylomirabilota bacterium]|jgi:outer membrane protein OmpA-like peptidoglycan-associated protein
MIRVSLALGSLTLIVLGCARHAEPPRAALVVAEPTPPAALEAAPAPSAPAPDAAALASPPEPLTEFAARDELKDVHFASGQIQVQRSEWKILDATAAWLKANPSQLVILEGYTDAAGPRAANLALAQRRAKWVMDYLVGKGVPASRITVVSRGETGTLCADKSPACQGRNRRVRVLVRESGPLQLSASPTP